MAHYECSICWLYFDTEGERLYDDPYIPALGHDVGEDYCCRREGCGAEFTFDGTITIGEEVKLDFCLCKNTFDAREYPVYRIEVEDCLLAMTIPQDFGGDISDIVFFVYDKDFNIINNNRGIWYYGDNYNFTKGVYYLSPVAFTNDEDEIVDEIVLKDCPVTLYKTTPWGDVNGDGSVDIYDVKAIENIILGKAPYDSKADLNEDGRVTILDVTILIDYLNYSE